MTVPYWSSTHCNGSGIPQKPVQLLPTPYTAQQNQTSVASLTQQQALMKPAVSTPFLIKARQFIPAQSQESADSRLRVAQHNTVTPYPYQQQPAKTPPGYMEQLQQMSMVAQTSQITYNQPQLQLQPVQCEPPRLHQPAQFIPIPAQQFDSKLIQHEPCIHTLRYLEARVEQQKQMAKARSDQTQVLWQQSARQRMEITQLKEQCKSKDYTIGLLKSQIGTENRNEVRIAEVSRLKAVIKGQREELERIRSAKDQRSRLKQGSMVKLKEVNPQKRYGVEGSRNTNDRINEEEKQPNGEANRLKEENMAFRLEIARLERENSEVSRLRLKLQNLNKKLGKMTMSQFVSHNEPLLQNPTSRSIQQVPHAISDRPQTQ